MKKCSSFILILCLITGLLAPSSFSAAARFSDVSSTHWASQQIQFLTTQGVISGFRDGSFKPEASVTRGQAAIMLVRALNLPTSGAPNPGFRDVPKSHSAYPYVAALVSANVYPKGTSFAPDKVLTREEMARFLVNGYRLTGEKFVTFSDVSLDYWAQPYISLLAENGITAGFSNGSFQPKGPVTRAQFSVFLSRAMDDRFKVEKALPPTSADPVLMKDIRFGMTWQQVLDRETRPLYHKSASIGETAFQTYEVELFDVIPSHLIYSFRYGTFDLAWYDLNPDDVYMSTSSLREIYTSLQNILTLDYGTVDAYDEPYSSSYINSTSMWSAGSYTVLLHVENVSGSSEIAISYHNSADTSAASASAARIKQALSSLNESQTVYSNGSSDSR